MLGDGAVGAGAGRGRRCTAGTVGTCGARRPVPRAQSSAAEAGTDGALRLEALLGQHTIQAGDLMRGRLRNDEDFAQAANAAVGQNTEELAQQVGALGGADAAARFQGLWTDHVTALVNYSRGLATNDAAVRDEARARLDALNGEIADVARHGHAGAAGPRDGAEGAGHARRPPGRAGGRLRREGLRAAPTPRYREGYQHAFRLGGTLATGLLPPDQAAGLGAPAWQLRSEMTRLLGEHVGLALGTLRAGATNGPDFPAMVDSLNGNTTDVTAAVGSLFGEPAASQFMSLWADHLDLLGTYAADVGADKQNRRQAVQDDLHNWQQRFATFIDTATQSRVPAPDLAAALLGLDDLLLQQVDAFAARDFPRAQQLANQTYPQVFGLARNMADAFGATLAARMPQGGAKTGAGGMAADLVPPAAAPPPAALPPPAAAPGPFRSVRTYQEVAPPVRLRIPAVRIDTPLQRLGRAADSTVEVPARLRGRRLVRRRAAARSERAGGDPRPRRLAHRPRRVLPARRAGGGYRGAGRPRGRQHRRVPGERCRDRPEVRVPHRPGVRAHPAVVAAARDVRWPVRPRSRELPRQCHRLRRPGGLAGPSCSSVAARPACCCLPALLAAPARRAQPPLVAVPAGTADGQVRLVVQVPGGPVPPDAIGASVNGESQDARAEPVLSGRLATALVVDASADGGPMLPVGLAGGANLVLAAPPTTRSTLVTDTTPPAVALPWPSGPADTLRALSDVRAGGARSTAAALDLAVAQLRAGATDPRLVVLYTGAPDAGGEPAATVVERMRAAGVVLAVVGSGETASPFWTAVAEGTGGMAVTAGPSGVIGAFDQVTAALGTRYLLTFPAPARLPATVAVQVDTAGGPAVDRGDRDAGCGPARQRWHGPGRRRGDRRDASRWSSSPVRSCWSAGGRAGGEPARWSGRSGASRRCPATSSTARRCGRR